MPKDHAKIARIIESLAASLQPTARLFEMISKFAVLFAIISWFYEMPARKEQRDNTAWALVNAAQGKGGNGGRTSALQTLNHDGVSLAGIDLSGAYLSGVKLKKAYLAHANFRHADLSSAVFGCGAVEALASHLLFRSLTECTYLGNTDFLDSELDFTDFRRAFFDKSLLGSEGSIRTYHNVAFTAAIFADTRFENIEFFEPDFSKVTMYRTRFENVRFSYEACCYSGMFDNASLQDVDLSTTNIDIKLLQKAKLCRVKLPNGERLDGGC